MVKKLIILDRDGVINKLLWNNGPDSPMSLSDIAVFPWIPKALKQLNDFGYSLCIATNQPSWAKGKISLESLSTIHAEIVNQAQSTGAKILSSHICFHRTEDNCDCKKPKPGLLQECLKLHNIPPENVWMVGDRSVDVIPAKLLGMKAALIGYESEEPAKLKAHKIIPDYLGINLQDFVEHLLYWGT